MVALVQRPAPTFKAEAVANGLFVDVDLEKYRGQWYVFMGWHGRTWQLTDTRL